MRFASATLFEERGSARRGVSDLQALTLLSGSEASALRIRAAELADCACEQDWYKCSLRSATARLQGLQNDYPSIFSRTKGLQFVRIEQLGSLFSEFESFSY